MSTRQQQARKRTKTPAPARRQEGARKARPRRRGGRRQARPAGSNTEDLIAQINPFAKERGAKLHDRNSALSAAYRSRTLYSWTPTSAGKGLIYVLGRLNSCYYPAPTFTTNSWPTTAAGTAANVSDYTSLNTAFDKARIVNWGVRVRCTTAALDASGYITFFTYGATANPAAFNPASELPARRDEYAITAGSCYEWWSKPLDNQAEEYALTGALTLSDPWETLIVTVDTSSANTFRVEIIFNLEAIPATGSITEKLSTEAAPDQPDFRARIADVRRSVDNVRAVANAAYSVGSALFSAGQLLYNQPINQNRRITYY